MDGKYDDFDYDGSGVHAYVVDTGIRATHSEFSGRIGDGFSSVTGTSVTGTSDDCHGHGTHVASTIGGSTYGLAKKVTLHPVRVLDCAGYGSDITVIAGLQWASTNIAKNGFPSVVNMSLGGPRSEAVNDAVKALTDRNIVVVVAAGNDYARNACDVSPASAASALTVAATDSTDSRANFSNVGPCIDIFAPGVDVLGASIRSDSAAIRLSGTSMASPHVAGAVALFLQRYPRLSANQVSSEILSKSTPGLVVDPRSANQFLYTNFGRPTGNLCYGRCGGQSPDFTCGCDTFCTILGDCCADFRTACP
jgi:subtilisin family serine protease